MADARTKVDALKDLGEKVTGATLVANENETIVGMIDKITDNYSGGGSGGGQNIAYLQNLGYEEEWTNITDDGNLAELEKVIAKNMETGEIPTIVEAIEGSHQNAMPFLTYSIMIEQRNNVVYGEINTLQIQEDSINRYLFMKSKDRETGEYRWQSKWIDGSV